MNRELEEPLGQLRSVRAWLALAIVTTSYFITRPATSALYHVIGHPLHLHAGPPNTLMQGSFAVSMFAYVIWTATVFCMVSLALGRSPAAFPIKDRAWLRRSAAGAATGLAVMLCVIGAIWLAGDARISPSHQTLADAIRNGVAWLALDYVGATGEELFNRAALYLAVASLLGWRAAVAASGLLFLIEHLGNPGASPAWLLRIGLQGVLLAYAVHRTRAIWWSVAYHAGWNWISAPLFGAAGSGYLDQGHIFDFAPHGPGLITGGPVGPEGSVFAFMAVLLALGILVWTTRRGPSESASAQLHSVS